MPKDGVSPILDNDVCMRFENGDDLFLCRNALSYQNTPARLINHFFGKPGIVLELLMVCTTDLALKGNYLLCSTGIFNYRICRLDKINIGFLAILFAFGIHNGQHAPLYPFGMIRKTRHLAELITHAFDDSRQDTNTIPQKVRVPWLMDRAFHACAICTYHSAFFDALFVGIAQDVTVNQLPGLCADPLDVAVQGGLLKTFISNANTAKPTQRLRVDDVKGQLFISEVKKDFNDSTAQDLFSGHTMCTATSLHNFAPVQILQNLIVDVRLAVKYDADCLQLLTLGVIHYVGHQRHLFLPFFAHFLPGSFSAFVVILGCWCFPLYYKK